MNRKKTIIILLAFLLIMVNMEYTNVMAATNDVFYISAGGKQLKVQMENNESARELKEALSDGNISVRMSRNGGFEQYGDIGRTLTSNDTRIKAGSGDVILYNSRYLCIFYGSNTYSYTKIGKIQGMSNDELKNLLSEKDLTMTLSLNSFGEVPNTGIRDMTVKFRIMSVAGIMAIISLGVVLFRRRREKNVA
jgi:hypothetical protein